MADYRDILSDLPAGPVFDQLPEGAYAVDTNRVIVHWNRAAEEITGFAAEEVTGHPCYDEILLHVDGCGTHLCRGGCPLLKTLEDGCPRRAQVYLHHRQGHRVPVMVSVSPLRGADGAIIGALEVFSDGTALRLLSEQVEQLNQVALLDALTGLPNRRYAQTQLEAMLSQRLRHGLPGGVVLLDIDHFKRVNDTYGHGVGDRVLMVVGATLAAATRPSDLVARWGGEEFLLLLPQVDPAGVHECVERCRALIACSGLRDDGAETITVTASFGATMVREDDTPDSAVARADALMYRSKESGRNRVTMD